MSDHLRNKPRQARSLRTFNHILDTAAALFQTEGYDAVTTNHIAAAAEVSIGALYRFFPNKKAILEALTDRYREAMAAIFPEDIQPPRSMPDILDEMFANLMAFEAAHVGFETIFLKLESGAARERIIHADIVGWVESVLAAHYPHLDAERRRIGAEVGVSIVKGLLPLMKPPANYAQAHILPEMRAALLAYMGDFLARED